MTRVPMPFWVLRGRKRRRRILLLIIVVRAVYFINLTCMVVCILTPRFILELEESYVLTIISQGRSGFLWKTISWWPQRHLGSLQCHQNSQSKEFSAGFSWLVSETLSGLPLFAFASVYVVCSLDLSQSFFQIPWLLGCPVKLVTLLNDRFLLHISWSRIIL